MAWDPAAKVDFANKYPSLLYKTDYLEIQKFMTSEAAVNKVLTTMENNVFADCSSPDAFLKKLGVLEQEYGFSPDVKTINSILTAVDFVMYVYAARPLHDLGAGEAHGYATHRVQWIMVAIYQAMTGTLIKTPIKELYSNLACANAYVQAAAGPYNAQTGKGWLFLWDDLFDRFFFKPPHVRNATSPEYLHSVHVEANYKALSRIWL